MLDVAACCWLLQLHFTFVCGLVPLLHSCTVSKLLYYQHRETWYNDIWHLVCALTLAGWRFDLNVGDFGIWASLLVLLCHYLARIPYFAQSIKPSIQNNHFVTLQHPGRYLMNPPYTKPVRGGKMLFFRVFSHKRIGWDDLGVMRSFTYSCMPCFVDALVFAFV